MKSQKNMYPYDESNICLVIKGLDMNKAFENYDSGKFTLHSSCFVSPNPRCIRERVECLLDNNEIIYAIYSLKDLKQWSQTYINRDLITLNNTPDSTFWHVDYIIDNQNHPLSFYSDSALEIISYLLQNKGVLPFFIKSNETIEKVIMKMEDIAFGLSNDYEYVEDFYHNEEKPNDNKMNKPDFISRIESGYKSLFKK